jgi:hypothetical protein
MPSGTVNLSGSGPQQGYVWVSYVSYNQAGNYSTWYWEAVFKNNGGLNWILDGNRWRLTGFAVSSWAGFQIPSSWAGSGDHMLGSGYFTKGHNADGYLSAGTLSMTIETDHSAIGSGTANASTGTPPRIPKVPDAPPAPGFVSAEPDSLTFSIAQPADNGGSAILDYDIQVLEEISSPDDIVLEWSGAKGSPQSTASKGSLDPSTKYRIRYRARNAIGRGPWSATTMMETPAGAWISDGTKWVSAPLKVSTGSAWASEPIQISDGSTWEDPA